MVATLIYRVLRREILWEDVAAQAQITLTTSLDLMLSLAVEVAVTAQLPMVQLLPRHMVAVLCMVQGVEQAVGMERLEGQRLEKLVELGVHTHQEPVVELLVLGARHRVLEGQAMIMRSVAVTAEEAAAVPLVVMLAGPEEREAHQAEAEEREAVLILGQVGLAVQAQTAKSGFGLIR